MTTHSMLLFTITPNLKAIYITSQSVVRCIGLWNGGIFYSLVPTDPHAYGITLCRYMIYPRLVAIRALHCQGLRVSVCLSVCPILFSLPLLPPLPLLPLLLLLLPLLLRPLLAAVTDPPPPPPLPKPPHHLPSPLPSGYNLALRLCRLPCPGLCAGV